MIQYVHTDIVFTVIITAKGPVFLLASLFVDASTTLSYTVTRM
jgi:hypothetical protein